MDEFFAGGDLDGDGRRDVVIVDRASGAYRAGYQLSADTFTWPAPRAGGVDDVTGVSLGKFLTTGRDALALTSVSANRINLIDAASVTVAGLPVAVPVPSTLALLQDFESGTAVNYTLSQTGTAPGPTVQATTTRFLRLIYDGVNGNANAVTFTQTAPGLHQCVQAEFDFRMSSVDQPADGFAFMLIPTATYGTNGAGYVTQIAFEEPNIAGVFAVAFDVFDFSGPINETSVHWNGAVRQAVSVPTANVNLTSGNFHRARVALTHVAGGANVTVTLVPNISTAPGTPYTVVSNLFIPGLNPYDCRVEFAARTGALDLSLDLDNINVQFLSDSAENSPVAPALVVGADVGGAGGTTLDDFVVGTVFNSEPSPNQLSLVRNFTGASFGPIQNQSVEALMQRGNAVLASSAKPRLAGMMVRAVGNDIFRAYKLTAGALQIDLAASNLPPGADYVFANFAGGALSQFLFYAPGQSNLLLYPVQEPVPGTYQFGASTPFNLGNGIRQVVTIPTATSTKLLVIFGNGESAAIYNFNGSTAPALVQQLTAEAGETFNGAGALGGDKFLMLSGRNGSRLSNHYQQYSFNGSSYVAGAGGALPALSALGHRANVFLFQGEPFVVARAALVRSLNAGDWSSMLTGIPGALNVTAETFQNTTAGLGNPSSTPVGSSPTGANAGLVNQYTNSISLFAYTPAEGDTISDVSITPPSGTYPTSIVARLTSSNPNDSLYYRFDGTGGWTRYNANSPLRIFTNTTVFYYGQAAFGSAKSRIKAAAYQFSKPPGVLDSDGDGVPDYVEFAQGTDPNKGDTDGDGYSDFSELLGGTNPRVAQTNQPVFLPLGSQYGVVFGLHPVDGSGSITVGPGLGVNAYGRTIGGGLLEQGITVVPAGGSNPIVRLSNLVLTPGQRLLVLHTDPNFEVQTPGPDKNVGRELIGLVPVPEARTSVPQAYEYSGGNIYDEANAWIAATSNALRQSSGPVIIADVGVPETIAALLLERKVGEILTDRGDPRGSNVTLFPFRAADAGRSTISDATLLALESSPTNTQPAFSLRTMLDVLSDGLRNPADSAAEPLRQLSLAVYRLSARSNNVTPGVYPSPVDVLREFVGTGNLHSNYFNGLMLSAGDLADEQQAVRNMLNRLTPRPAVSRTLEVRADTFGGPCTTLDWVGAGTQVSLFHAGGSPYNLLTGFRLAPGTQVSVTGYSDITGGSCSGEAIEVTSLSFVSAPAASSTDADGDLLADAWEAAFAVSDPNADDDNDGATNLAEFLAGTDPRDPNSHPAAPSLVGFEPPLVSIEKLADGNVRLGWSVPQEWLGRLEFKLLATPSIVEPFTETGLLPLRSGTRFEVTVPAAEAQARFYKVAVSAR